MFLAKVAGGRWRAFKSKPGTLAADYYRAMGQVERLLDMPAGQRISIATPAELVTMIDTLGSGTLNEHQRETLQALRNGIMALAVGEPAQV
jgi:hypothetical protein